MFFLFGETLRSNTSAASTRVCESCGCEQAFAHVTETLWSTVFFIPILKIETHADYDQCEGCNNAFDSDVSIPADVSPVKRALAYFMLGYGMSEYHEMVRSLSSTITGFDFDEKEMRAEIHSLESNSIDINEYMQSQAVRLNAKGKQHVIEAAFLVTYAACEIEYEDRLRINQLGTALGVPLQFVEAVIEGLRRQNYKGVQRHVPTTPAL